MATDGRDRARLSVEGSIAVEVLDQGLVAGDVQMLVAGIELARSVVDGLDGEELPVVSDCRVRLALALWQRSYDTDDDTALDEAISVGMTEIGSPDGRKNTEFAASMVGMLLRRHETTGASADIDEAVRLAESLLPNVRGAERAWFSTVLAEALRVRFQYGGRPEDRDHCITYLRSACDHLEDEEERLMAVSQLYDLLLTRWGVESRLTDLDEVIDLGSVLMSEMERHEPLRADLLAMARAQVDLRWQRLERTGEVGQLDGLADLARQVQQYACPPTSSDLSNLCYILQLRYRQSSELADLEEAVVAGRQSVRVLSFDVDQACRHLSNLFGALCSLAEATGAVSAFTEAVEVAERAAAIVPSGMNVANLATALWGRFLATDNQDDLDRSIEVASLALEAPADDEPELANLKATLVAGLTLRFQRFQDDDALDQAMAVVRKGIRADPAWLNSLAGLLHAIEDCHAREPKVAAQTRYRELRNEARFVYQRTLLVCSTQLADTAAATSNLELFDQALDGLQTLVELDDIPRLPHLGLWGEILVLRWQLSRSRSDLDSAIDLLRHAAGDSSSEPSREVIAGHHAKAAATALVRRFRRRRRIEDLEEARRYAERAVSLIPASDGDAHDDLHRTLQSIDRAMTKPPLFIVQSDVGEGDREDLASTHGLANMTAWNEGKPRVSGLTWRHACEPEESDELLNAGSYLSPREPASGRRVLLLRTFRDDDTNFVVLNSLALALTGNDRIEVIGDIRDRERVNAHWELAFGAESTPGSRIDFVVSTSSDWKGEALSRIHAADAIVLCISPKDVDFPEFSFSQPRTIAEGFDWEYQMDAPLSLPLTGRGLLREISYLNRLQRWSDTVVVCDLEHQPTLDDLIALGGMMGSATDLAGNLITPRLTAADKQVGHLGKAFRGITYRGAVAPAAVLPGFARKMGEVLGEILDTTRPEEVPPWHPQDLVGRSLRARRLPPDNGNKVIPFTDLEDLFFIPSGEIIEIDHREVLDILSPISAQVGCPYCRAPIGQMFFYIPGLERLDKPEEHHELRARCQVCGRKSSLWGDDQLAPQ